MSNPPYYLLAPGPVSIPKSILDTLSLPMIHHRTPEFTNILLRVLTRLKPLFQTQNPVLLLPTTGSGAMEAALVNSLSPGDEILIIQAGKFGERWTQIAQAYGITPHIIDIKWGEKASKSLVETQLKKHPNIKALCIQACETSTAVDHPIKDICEIFKNDSQKIIIVDAITALVYQNIPMDKWGIDILLGGSQKAFMLPTGLSLISLSQKAWSFYASAKCPRFYLDLKKELNANKKGQTFFSSLVTHIRSLDAVLNFFDDQGLEFIQKKALNIQQAINLSAKELGLNIFSTSTTVTAIEFPESIKASVLQKKLITQYNITVAGGQEHLKDRIIRLSHMGDISKLAIEAFFIALIIELQKLDFNITSEQNDNVKKIINDCMSTTNA